MLEISNPDIQAVLELLMQPLRLVATLRVKLRTAVARNGSQGKGEQASTYSPVIVLTSFHNHR